ncbi:hypothetical protein AN219_18655 [Streptomyces nanshensis]|nr:hypothetical protein AN219_18655 [Streptomyces nanshensis]
MGVVVGLPGESAKSYHLRVPGGGGDWRAKGDGTTLRPVSVPVTHATPRDGVARYDEGAGTTTVPISVHHEDGATSDLSLVLTADEVARYHAQYGDLIARRSAS